MVEVYNLSGLEIEKYVNVLNSILNIYTSLDVESKLHTVNDYIFYKDDDVVYLIGYTGNSTQLTLPDNFNGKNYKIKDRAFYNCTNLTNIIISNGVTSIGYRTFYNCSSLTSITILDGLTSIESYAFEDCSSLTNITIPSSVMYIQSSAFNGTAYYNNKSNWDNSVLYIGNHLIVSEKGISENYSIKQGTICIANGAFYNCSSLTSITIPDGVTRIESSAFYDCSNLKSITIPDSVTRIADSAFSGCSSLTSVYYGGTSTEWQNISIDSNKSPLASATIYYYSEEEPTVDGNYWHYVEGEVVVWGKEN